MGRRKPKNLPTETEVRDREKAVQTVRAVKELEKKLGFRPKFKHVAEELGVSLATATRRIHKAEEMGCLVMDESRRGTLTVADGWR
jgi:Mn-dependent DtxR family transcriptional regulator